jgi:hypothetical protein
MCATEEVAADFHSMPNHFAFTVLADRGHCLDRALEAIEDVPRASRDQFKTLVVVVSTNLALCHGTSSFSITEASLVIDVRARA